MHKLDLHKIVFPLISIGTKHSSFLGLWGTSFSLGGGYYITAKHVIESAVSSIESGSAEHLGIGQPEETTHTEKEWIFSTFDEYEFHPHLDIALFKVPDDFENVVVLPWVTKSLNIFDDVRAGGYPYSLDLQNKVINVRGIKGHVIGTGRHIEGRINFQSYELSFNPPRGLSGAPILFGDAIPRVSGVVIGNRTHEMEVSSSEEISVTNDITEIYSKIEMMHIGICIQSSEFISYKFQLLNSSIEEWIKKNII